MVGADPRDCGGVLTSPPPTPTDWDRARTLVLALGWNATAYQILNPGFLLWFSAAGDAVIGYARHAGVRVVAGAPIAADDRLPDVIAEFAEDAARHHEHVCYFGAGARLEGLLGPSPHHSLMLLGAQPVWRPSFWDAAMRRRPSVRAQLHRARNKGVAVDEWSPDRAHEHPELRRCLTEWLASRHLPPLHFMIEPETLGNLTDRRIFVAIREGAGVVGFTIASPVPARRGWMLEQIIRGREAPNGTAELLVDTAMRAFADAGAEYATLGLAPLSHRATLPTVRHPWWLRGLLEWTRVHGRRFYNFDGLDAFKAKFAPEMWEPIYAIGDTAGIAPRTLYAIAGAFSGGAPIRLALRAGGGAVREEARRAASLLRGRRAPRRAGG